MPIVSVESAVGCRLSESTCGTAPFLVVVDDPFESMKGYGRVLV